MNLIGQKFGKLVVREINHKDRHGVYYLCKCDCGNTTVVRASYLMAGHTKSCGCLKSSTRRLNKFTRRLNKFTDIDRKELSMISDKDRLRMFDMRLKGYTLEEIGLEFEISRERVRQIFRSAISRSTSLERGRKKIVYPNIAKWLKDNDVSIGEFAEKMGNKKNSVTRLRHNLSNEHTKGFLMPEILKILEITGMSFEEAFKVREKE